MSDLENGILATVEKHMPESKAPEAPKDAKPEAAPVSSPESASPKPVETSVEPVKAPTNEEIDWAKVPAHFHPRFKELQAEKKRLKEELDAREKLLADPRIKRLLAVGEEAGKAEEATPAPKSQTQHAPEEVEAIQKLRAVLGLDPLEATTKELREFLDNQRKESFERKYNDVESGVRKNAEALGLDWETEVEPALRDWYVQNPEMQGTGPKSLQIAFNSAFFEKQGELRERAANLKLIKEREEKKAVGSEGPASASTPTTSKPKSIIDYVAGVHDSQGIQF